MRQFVRGQSVQRPDGAIQLFSILEGMKWNHLPNPGGYYAQDPVLMDKFKVIFLERSVAQEEDRKKTERQNSGKRQSLSKRRGR